MEVKLNEKQYERANKAVFRLQMIIHVLLFIPNMMGVLLSMKSSMLLAGTLTVCIIMNIIAVV